MTIRVFSQAGSGTLDWNEQPVTIGSAAPTTAVYQAQPGVFTTTECAGCRQGNTFYPLFHEVNGANPTTGLAYVGFTAGSIHLYDSSGKELTPSTEPGVGTYYENLPSARQTYRLVVDPFQLSGFGRSSTATESDTWHFASAEPKRSENLANLVCWGTVRHTSFAPCGAPPLVFLRYDAGLSLGNTIATGTRELRVTGYDQDPSAPPVTSLKLWTSTDGGTTWIPAKVTGGHDGTFTVTYAVPASGTDGYVSIKAQATDSAGNYTTQEIDDAYAIAAS